MSIRIPRIVITPGEPAGIGPDVLLQAASQSFPAELIVIADPQMLLDRAKQLNLNVTLKTADLAKPAVLHEPNTLQILPVKLTGPVKAGKLNMANAAYVMRCLGLAVDLCLEKKVDALVTGPINKAAISAAGIPFTGHTEFLAERCRVDDVLMLFVVDQIKVALATTHIPLTQVSSAITIPHLIKTVTLLHHELQHRFQIKEPRIYITGLNPHAGEEGLLGREEIEVIQPAIKQLQQSNIQALGPFPADTLFTPKHLRECDAVLAMYHDQALPVVKHIGFNQAVNVTLGLPIIRTSVDHGTALDIAGTHQADAGSLIEAIHLAIHLA